MSQQAEMQQAGKPTVLLVECHGDTLSLYAEYFAYRGFHVLTASRGHEALQIAARRQPDVVCASYRLEEIDGADLAARLKGRKDTSTIPVIVTTSFVSPTDLRRARESGADAVLLTPLLPATLVDEALRLLKRAEKTSA